MTKVVIDDELASKFTQPSNCVELCDKTGRVLGYFYPVGDEDAALYDGLQFPESEDELDRRETESGTSLDEFWRRMDAK